MDEINDWKKNLKGAADFFEVDAELLLKRLKERGVTDNPKQYFSDHKNLDYEYEIGPALKPISPIHSFVETLMLELNTERGVLCIDYGEQNENWFPEEPLNPYFDRYLRLELNGLNWESNLEDGVEFSVIFGDFPIGPGDNRELIKSLSYLNETGTAFYIVKPGILDGKKGESFKRQLKLIGCYATAIFEAPEKILKNSGIVPNLIAIRRERSDDIFVGKLRNFLQATELGEIYCNRSEKDSNDKDSQKDLYEGVIVPINNFFNFDQLSANIQIDKLETSYKEYKQYLLKDLALEINSVGYGGEFEECENSIYIPNIGKSGVVCRSAKTKNKHQNYFQVLLNDKVLNEYIALFFASDIGRLTLDSLAGGSFIKKINKSNIGNAVVALPDFSTQQQIVTTQNKINDLQDTIQEFSKEVALNPTSSVEISDKLDDMLNVVGNLTEADKIRSLSRLPESTNLEFKETLCWDVRKKQKDKDRIEKSALKTLVGFMNNEGGTLLVGVADNGEIKGINTEVEKLHRGSLDKFKLYLADRLKHRIGEEYYEFYKNYEVYDVDGKLVLKVNCKPYDEHPGVYLDGSDFYLRGNPRTTLLEGKALAEYTKKHFA